MNEAISNIWRRPLRTALTILGIVIGRPRVPLEWLLGEPELGVSFWECIPMGAQALLCRPPSNGG